MLFRIFQIILCDISTCIYWSDKHHCMAYSDVYAIYTACSSVSTDPNHGTSFLNMIKERDLNEHYEQCKQLNVRPHRKVIESVLDRVCYKLL